MKKNVISAKTLSIALLCVLVTLIPSLTSCRKEKSADTADLLATVPSSAGVVVGFNLASLLEKVGCKVEDSSITSGKDIEQILANQTLADSSTKEVIEMLLSGESGIDPIGALIFTDAYSTYMTAALADTDKFSDFVEKQSGIKFEDAGNNVKIAGNIAVKGPQTWIALNSSNSIDAKAIQNYSTLEQTQSFASLPIASDIATMTHDIVGYGQLKNVMKFFSFGSFSSVNLMVGFLFENPSALSFHIDFLKGEAKTKAMILNDKNKPAKYLMPGDKINIDVVKELSQSANMIFAMSITKDFVKKVTKMADGFGGIAQPIKEGINSLDGTAAVAFSDLKDFTENNKLILTTNGNPSMSLMQLLSPFGNLRKEDNQLILSNGVVTGSVDVQKMADKLKGAAIGTIAYPDNNGLINLNLGIKILTLTLNPEDGSLSLNGWIETQEPDVNSLLTILKNITN